MLINKLLLNNGYIFVTNTDIHYLSRLYVLGWIPIFMQIKGNHRLYRFFNPNQDYTSICISPCQTAEIKYVLKYIESTKERNISVHRTIRYLCGIDDSYYLKTSQFLYENGYYKSC